MTGVAFAALYDLQTPLHFEVHIVVAQKLQVLLGRGGGRPVRSQFGVAKHSTNLHRLTFHSEGVVFPARDCVHFA
jgi:hypothetical protein